MRCDRVRRTALLPPAIGPIYIAFDSAVRELCPSHQQSGTLTGSKSRLAMKLSSTLRMEAIGLATIAGYIDGYALRVFGIYVSFMSGNTTLTGVNAGQGKFSAALPPALSIAGFVGGSFIGNWSVHSGIAHARRLLLITSAALVACFVGLNLHPFQYASLSLPILSLAMGMMNPAVTRVGSEPVSLTFVTGTLNKVGDHLALAVLRTAPADAEAGWDTHFYRAFLEASVWAGFLTGAVLSGLLSFHFGVLELAPACLALIAFALVSSNLPSKPMTPREGRPTHL
jgi:uncharacterized membrane protein YoaK (UPF0700 family)